MEWSECEACGRTMEPSRRAAVCSPSCRTWARQNSGRYRSALRCVVCAGDLGVRARRDKSYCSERCRRINYFGTRKPWRQPKVTKTCEECGKDFRTKDDYRIRFCSRSCKDRVCERRRRAAGVESADFGAAEIFDRDGWTCQLCADPIDRELLGTIDPQAPSLDHVIPISKGGPHTRANVQATHLRCNLSKYDSVFDSQMVLFR